MKKTQINIDIELNENHVPENMSWTAQDGGVENQATKAMLLSLWDSPNKEAMRIDLWTKDMPLDEMKMFFHQIFVSLSHTYERASSEVKVAEMIREFAEDFAKAAEIK